MGQGLCPFHAEKTPSFSVNAEEGLYYCFGCQAKGDVITFVREVEHLDFVEAVERLAGRAGIQLRYDDAATSRDRQRRARAGRGDGRGGRLVPRAAAHRRPTPPRRAAYLRSRGYDGDVVRAVPARLGARRLGRAGPRAAAARRRAARHRPRVRQPAQPPAGRVPRPGHVPDLRRRRRARGLRRAGAARTATVRSTRTRRRRRSTRRAACSTASTGPRATSSTPARSSCARATPT